MPFSDFLHYLLSEYLSSAVCSLNNLAAGSLHFQRLFEDDLDKVLRVS